MRFQKIKKFLSKSKVWLIVIVMAAIAVLPIAFTDCNSVGAGTFTMWLASGEQDQYYMNYEDNPIIRYLSKEEWGEEGEKSKLNFEFHVAPKGTEGDNFGTLVNTGAYEDIMALDYSKTSIMELYKKGVAMDLTDYVLGPNKDGEGSLMPNYYEQITSDDAVYREAVTIVNGEPKILQICALNDAGRDMYQGLMYRRDWLVRFGEMPEYVWATDADSIMQLEHSQRQGTAPEITNYFKARAAYGTDESKWTAGGWKKNSLYNTTQNNDADFEVGVGGTRGCGIITTYGNDPMNTFTDNLLFPSGTSDPVYLSDWEWMFETFETKVWNNSSYKDKDGETLNKSNSYMMSVLYMGTSTRGDLSSSFGGGCPNIFYNKRTGKIENGLTSESTRLYLEYMNGWYKKGWLDNAFTSRSNDTFYKIDEAGMIEGRIPAYMGSISSQLGNVMDSTTHPLTKGIMVVGARLPMNDVTGAADYRFVEPDTIYQEGKVSSKCMITNAAAGKNIPALLNFIDYLYSEEGARLVSFGFDKAQYEETQDSFYKKYGMTSGAYYVDDTASIENGGDGRIYKYAENNPEDTTLNTALKLHRVPFGLHYVGTCDHGYTTIKQKAVDCWNYYPNTGDVFNDLTAKVDATNEYNNAYTEFMNALTQKLASPIKAGSATSFDTYWKRLCDAAGSHGNVLCRYLQEVLDSYN